MIKSDGKLLYSLIQEKWEIIPTPMADEFARANGFRRAKQLIKEYAGKTFSVNKHSLKIIEAQK